MSQRVYPVRLGGSAFEKADGKDKMSVNVECHDGAGDCGQIRASELLGALFTKLLSQFRTRVKYS